MFIGQSHRSKAFSNHCPEMFELMQKLTNFAKEGKSPLEWKNFPENHENFRRLRAYGPIIVMACGTFKWDDVGSYQH